MLLFLWRISLVCICSQSSCFGGLVPGAESISMAEVLPSLLPSDFDEAATQAAIKGGIGFFVAQGLAKRGHTCNPNHSCFSPTITRKSLQQQLRNTWTSCPSVDHAGEAVFHRPAFDFERHNKADVFRVSSRYLARFAVLFLCICAIARTMCPYHIALLFTDRQGALIWTLAASGQRYHSSKMIPSVSGIILKY